MKNPNLFVVGAPKCATTAIHAYLAQHPECFMSAVKEPAYFSRAHVRDDIRRTLPYLQDEAAYLKLFSEANDTHRIVGESSTSYMRAAADLEELRAFSGRPKIVASVRDPVLLVSSYFHYLRFQGWEPLDTLREAWDIQDERCAGNIDSATAYRPDSLAYRNVALLGQQVERLFDMFGRENVLVLVVDNLRAHTAEVCRSLQEFLGLTYAPDLEMPVRNVARVAKVQFIDGLMKGKSKNILWLKNRFKRMLGVRSLGIRRLVESYNSIPQGHAVDADLRDEMRAWFANDVALLGRLLHQDLFELWGWNQAAASEAPRAMRH